MYLPYKNKQQALVLVTPSATKFVQEGYGRTLIIFHAFSFLSFFLLINVCLAMVPSIRNLVFLAKRYHASLLLRQLLELFYV
jgi:hypothetical protein